MMFRLQLPPVIGGVMMLAAIVLLTRTLLYSARVNSEDKRLPLGRLDLA
jgi:hypothetical protein